jgi:UDP-N-acetylglucosamine 1-carboxyvinyltransferase
MEKFVIHGRKPLEGEIEARGAKNAAFPLLAATILTTEDCIISNLPLIEDVYRSIEILQSMGARVEWLQERTVKVNTKDLNPATLNRDLMLKLRGSVLFAGPLLARFTKVDLPQPGGDAIGARPINTHLDAFSQLGVVITPSSTGFHMEFSGKPKNAKVVLGEFSVTATENVLLFASLFQGPITIKIADQDYQVQELMAVLSQMGVAFRTPQLHTIVVEGRESLKGFSHRLMYDPIEAGTFVLLGAATGGNITVKNVELRFLDLFFKKLRDSKVLFEITREREGVGDVRVLPSPDIVIDKIQSWIYPGVHSDLQSAFGVLATQTPGSTLLHDPLYEGRLKYLEELTKMGAEIYFADPHRAIINGPSKLYGTNLGAFDLRGGAALIIAALIAEGTSTISNIYQVDRGYEKIEERLRKLGADIARVAS